MKAEVVIISLAFFMSAVTFCEACSCMRQHPQQHYCNSDFVILARVKRSRALNDTLVYKVRVRKEYKISEKGLLALKSGRLNTAKEDSLCGVSLEIGKLYVISGRIHSLKAYVNLCNMIVPWEQVTRRQRKGLKLMYRHGCTCQIRNCLWNRCYRTRDQCNWNSQCETSEGICLRQANNSCMWTRSRALTKCTQEWRRNMTSTYRKKQYLNPYPLP